MIIIDEKGHAETTLPEPKLAVKKPIKVEAREMPEPFQVQTMEGILVGKEGDFLITGVKGEMYPIDRKIFFETYEFINR